MRVILFSYVLTARFFQLARRALRCFCAFLWTNSCMLWLKKQNVSLVKKKGYTFDSRQGRNSSLVSTSQSRPVVTDFYFIFFYFCEFGVIIVHFLHLCSCKICLKTHFQVHLFLAVLNVLACL